MKKAGIAAACGRPCRALAVATRVVCVPGLGPRWLDQCRDCMLAGALLDWSAGRPPQGRYRVTLWAGGLPVMQGWWEERAIADAKAAAWFEAHRLLDGARVTLADEETGAVLTSLPRSVGARGRRSQVCAAPGACVVWCCSGPSSEVSHARSIWSGAISFGLVTSLT